MTATVRRVAPQRRGIVPPENEQRIRDALAGKEAADEELRAAVVAALKAGGSIREVMRVSGLSNDTVQRWGRAGGWPTAEDAARRTELRRRNAEFNRAVEQHATDDADPA